MNSLEVEGWIEQSYTTYVCITQVCTYVLFSCSIVLDCLSVYYELSVEQMILVQP